jgi:acyl dehydratase
LPAGASPAPDRPPAALPAPGTTVGPSAWRTIGQEEIDLFARLSGDRQWIHTDVERAARESPYGTTIAHGNLTLATIDGFRDELAPVGAGEGVRLGVNMGYDRVRFPAPVPAGARLRARAEILSVEPRGEGWWQLVQRFTVEVEGAEKPACVADSVVRVLLDA